MYVLAIILLIAFILYLEIKNHWNIDLIIPGVAILISIAVFALVLFADYKLQLQDEEIWSGSVTSVNHTEEWDEWHKPYDTTETYKDSNGNTHTRTVHHDGYWEHHYAENHIITSDGGDMYVEKSPDGKSFNDGWINSTKELERFWPIGSPSASVHSYENYVQSSYSIYRHKDINLKDYRELPDYPRQVTGYTSIDRFIGKIPDKKAALEELAKWNTEMNKSVPNPEKPGKMTSWKQVNLIFVNLGEVTEDWGFALQDHWENGNKNDFVVCFGTDVKGAITWVYPFSWADSQNSELLKIRIREYMLPLGKVQNYVPVIDNVSKMVCDLFERKQMAEFHYLQIPVSGAAQIVIWIFMIICGAAYFIVRKIEVEEFRVYNKAGRW